MKKFLAMLLSAALLCPAIAMAEDTIKIGIFEPMTGATGRRRLDGKRRFRSRQ